MQAPASRVAVSGAWETLGSGVNGAVRAVAVASNGDIYVGGDFTTAGGVTVNRIARWDGTTWHALDDGTGNPGVSVASSTGDPIVRALAIAGNGDLYVGGDFVNAGGVSTVNRIARWDGTSWNALGAGVGGSVTSTEGPIVRALAIAGNGDLYVGGDFVDAGGVSNVNRIARWNGASWSALTVGVGARVRALAINGTDLYVGGDFTSAGGVPNVNRIARWNTSLSTWNTLGTGTNAVVSSLAVDGSDLYAGGTFTAAGGAPANRVARWDGVSWSALDSGVDSFVQALAVDSSGNLYAGGNFTAAGGAPANRVARWDGVSWSALDSGVDSFVQALAVDSSDDLYAGGTFTAAGGAPASRIAKYNVEITSSANAGWRMLSVPVTGATVTDLTDINLVGGVQGDGACDSAAEGEPITLYTGYNGGQGGGNSGYTTPADYTDVLTPGKGFFWYFFAPPASTAGPCGSGGTASSAQPLPVVLSLPGTSPSADVDVTITASERVASDDAFYLAGNPFGQTIDLAGDFNGLTSITATDGNGAVTFQNTVQIWNAALNGYTVRTAQDDAGSDVAADNISVWQGMWLERSAVSVAYPMTITYAASARTDGVGEGIFVGRSGETVAHGLRTLRFEMRGTVGPNARPVYDGAASVFFAEGASEAWDGYDASKLGPLASPFALLAPVGQNRSGTLVRKAAESLAYEPGGAVDVSLAFYTSQPGTFELAWPEVVNIPDAWTLTLEDHVAGTTTDLRSNGSYAFESAASANWTDRFTLRVSAPAVAIEDGALPDAYSVGSVYPNPTAGGATLTVEVAETQQVRAEIYDMLGRRVFVLQDGVLAAGMPHRLVISDGRLAGGSYVVRVVGERFIEARRLTVVR